METFNHNILEAILAARHLTLRGVSERIGVPEAELREVISSNPLPNQRLLKALSSQLSVPSFVFYMDRPPPLGSALTDFRQTPPSVTPKLPATVETIALAERLQEVAIDLGHRDELPRKVAPASLRSPAYAASFREHLQIKLSDQTSARDARSFFALCRAAVERRGVIVLQESFPSEDGSGFCLAEGSVRVVVVNTHQQNHSRRNFTLFHEVGHLLLGRSGVSNPFVSNNSVEKTCNLFAAQMLIPQTLAEAAADRFKISGESSPDDIRRCAKFLNISQQATIVRLEQLQLLPQGYEARWLASVRDKGNPDYMSAGGGGGNTPQERVKLSKYGFTFASVFGAAIRRGVLSPLELYRMSGLKPKYQRPYFEFAAVAGAADAED